MADNSSIEEEEFFAAVTTSFFSWINNYFLPISLVVVYSILALLSLALNVSTLLVSVRARLQREAIHALLLQLCAVDLLACAFLLLPTLLSVAVDELAFHGLRAACRFQVVLFSWCLLLTYGFLMMAGIERTVRHLNADFHLKTLENVCVVRLLIVILWVVDLLISLAVLTADDQDIRFRQDRYQCALDYSSNLAVLHLILTFTLYSSPIVYFICFSLMFYRRALTISSAKSDKNQTDSRQAEGADTRPPHRQGSANSTSVFYLDMSQNRNINRSNSRIGASEVGPQHSERQRRLDPITKWTMGVRRVRERSRVVRIFRDDPSDADHHQSITYLITWSVVTLSWLVYFVAALAEAGGAQCGACYRVGVLVGLSTYSTKPLIYIAHNRWYRAHVGRLLQGLGTRLCRRGRHQKDHGAGPQSEPVS